MRPSSQYYYRRLLSINDDDGGDDDSQRNNESQKPPPLPSSSSSSSTATNPQFKPTFGFDSSMALTLLVLLAALFFMVFFSMYLRRFSEDNISRRRRRLQNLRPSSSSPDVDATAIGASSSFSSSNGLDPSTLRSLPLLTYVTKEEEPILCSVCLSEFQEKETMKMIPYCGHAFHPHCIDKWFSSHSSCPLCRSTQLFREPSSASASPAPAAALNKDKEKITEKKKKDCLVVEVNVLSSQKRFCSEHNHRFVIRECDESRGKSTVENGDTSIVVVVDDDDNKAPSGGLRRISSWSGLDDKVLLKRSSSF